MNVVPNPYFGNTNIHEWLDEETKEVVDNIQEEMVDDAKIVHTVETGHGDDNNIPQFF